MRRALRDITEDGGTGVVDWDINPVEANVGRVSSSGFGIGCLSFGQRHIVDGVSDAGDAGPGEGISDGVVFPRDVPSLGKTTPLLGKSCTG